MLSENVCCNSLDFLLVFLSFQQLETQKANLKVNQNLRNLGSQKFPLTPSSLDIFMGGPFVYARYNDESYVSRGPRGLHVRPSQILQGRSY